VRRISGSRIGWVERFRPIAPNLTHVLANCILTLTSHTHKTTMFCTATVAGLVKPHGLSSAASYMIYWTPAAAVAQLGRSLSRPQDV
jgi:hypothetical protein